MSYKTLSSEKVSDIVNRMGIYMPTQELEAFVNTMDDVAGANKDAVEGLVQRAEMSASEAQQDADAAFASAQVAATAADNAATNAAALATSKIDSALVQFEADALAALNDLGYAAPVTYDAGLSMATSNQTVEYNGNIYAPKSADLPFTTSGTFEEAKFRLVLQGSFLQSGVDAVHRPVDEKLREIVTPEDFGAVGDGISDDLAALQRAVEYCESNTDGAGRELYLPKKYKVSNSLIFSKQFVRVRGAGQNNSRIIPGPGSFPVITTASIIYFRPTFSDFSIAGGSAVGHTGKGVDLGNVTGEVYQGAFERMLITSGDTAFYAPRFFSMKMDTIMAWSETGHCFHVSCGPAVSWINCFANTCGPGKAGYRLKGSINMYASNGVNNCDYWGVFGNDLAAGDSWASDFDVSDFPQVNLNGCNIEHFKTCGILVHNAHRNFVIENCKIDRFGLSSDYDSVIRWRKSPANIRACARIGCGFYLPGSGVPNAGKGLSNAWFYVDLGANVPVVDTTGTLTSGGVSMALYNNNLVPFIRMNAGVNDVYQDQALDISAISPRRLSVRTLRYDVPAAITPVGTNQSIVVTGFTKVIVTPAASASISTATFASTLGAGNDYERNGDLIIEAGNSNLSIVHSASGANTFRLKSATNAAMSAGEIRRFVRSTTSSQWIEV